MLTPQLYCNGGAVDQYLSAVSIPFEKLSVAVHTFEFSTFDTVAVMLASFLFYVYLQLYILSILFNICIYHVCYRYTLFQYIGPFSVDVDILSRRSEAVRNHLNLLRVSLS